MDSPCTALRLLCLGLGLYACDSASNTGSQPQPSAEHWDAENIDIPDGEVAGIERALSVQQGEARVERVTVKVHLQHARGEDLLIHLLSPSGTQVILQEFAPADEERILVERTLTDFEDEPASGLWKLSVSDRARDVSGRLIAWGLSIEESQAAPPQIAITTNALPVINTCEGASVQLTATGAPNPSWRLLTASGYDPPYPGAQLQSTGLLSLAPTNALLSDSYSVTVEASQSGYTTATATLALVAGGISAHVRPTLDPAPLPIAQLGTDWQFSLQPDLSTHPCAPDAHYELDLNGTDIALQGWVTLNGDTLEAPAIHLASIPPGRYDLQLNLVYGQGSSVVLDSRTYDFVVQDPNNTTPITITTTQLPDTDACQGASVQLTATGAPAPSWRLLSASEFSPPAPLYPGAVLSSRGELELPATLDGAAQSYSIGVEASQSGHPSATAIFTINSAGTTGYAGTIVTADLPDIEQGADYTFAVDPAASQLACASSYRIVSNMSAPFPTGLSIDWNGALSALAADTSNLAIGSYAATVELVWNVDGSVLDSRDYALDVVAPTGQQVQITTQTLNASIDACQGATVQLTSSGAPNPTWRLLDPGELTLGPGPYLGASMSPSGLLTLAKTGSFSGFEYTLGVEVSQPGYGADRREWYMAGVNIGRYAVPTITLSALPPATRGTDWQVSLTPALNSHPCAPLVFYRIDLNNTDPTIQGWVDMTGPESIGASSTSLDVLPPGSYPLRIELVYQNTPNGSEIILDSRDYTFQLN